MSGHNKFSKIKHKKAATDAKKSKIFSKFNRLITMEARASGGNIDSPGLKAAIERAKAANMPNDNIDRAIKKAIEGSDAPMESVVYEAYGPGGSAIIITGVTDNKNRTAAEIRYTLSKNNIELAATGSASWAFQFKDGAYMAQTTTPLSEKDQEKLSSLIEELEDNDDVQEVYTNAE